MEPRPGLVSVPRCFLDSKISISSRSLVDLCGFAAGALADFWLVVLVGDALATASLSVRDKGSGRLGSNISAAVLVVADA